MKAKLYNSLFRQYAKHTITMLVFTFCYQYLFQEQQGAKKIFSNIVYPYFFTTRNKTLLITPILLNKEVALTFYLLGFFFPPLSHSQYLLTK